MQFFINITTMAALASNVLAVVPWASGKGSATMSSRPNHETGAHSRPRCLTNETASSIVTTYTYLIEKPTGPDFNSTAEALLTEGFTVWSDSIQFLRGKPVS